MEVEVKELTKHFPVYERGVILRRRIGDVHAVDQVSFQIRRNETLGLVGESGSGKTTIAKCMLYLEPPSSGNVFFEGKNITEIFKKAKRTQVLAARRQMQYIFQNPYASLDPRMTVADIIMEPFEVHHHIPRDQWLNRMYELLDNPLHPYTVALMSAIPVPDPKQKRHRIILPGEVPSPINPPSGCRFHPRCPRRIDICSKEEPPLIEVRPGHWLACYNPWPPKHVFA